MEQLKNYKIIFKDKIFFLYIVAGIIVSQSFMQLDLLFPLYIKEVIGASNLFAFHFTGEQLFGLLFLLMASLLQRLRSLSLVG